MCSYSEAELQASGDLISALIRNCEQMITKFKPGSSQHSLLVNRIKALSIALEFVKSKGQSALFTRSEREAALEPLRSIIRKCGKGQEKFAETHATYIRLERIIQAMTISISLIETGLQ